MQHLGALAKRYALTIQGRPCRLRPVSNPANAVPLIAIIKTSLDEAYGGSMTGSSFDITVGKEHSLNKGDRIEVLGSVGEPDVIQTLTISKPFSKQTELVVYQGVEF